MKNKLQEWFSGQLSLRQNALNEISNSNDLHTIKWYVDNIWYSHQSEAIYEFFINNDTAKAKQNFYLCGRIDDLLINTCKSLSISETFNISLSDNFELGDFMNLFYVQEIDVIDDFELDNLDDFAGSWGSVGIKFYFTGLLKRTDDYKAEIIINKMYFRLTDRFDFEGWQPLGNWSGSVFENNGKVTKPSLSSGYNLSNEDFRVLNVSSGNIFPAGYRPVTKYYEINKLFSKITISWDFWTSWAVE